MYLLAGEHGEILERLEVGWEKVAHWSTKAAISLKRIKVEKSYYGGPIGTHQRSFEQYQRRPPMASSSPRLGVRNPHQKLQSLLSQEWVKLQTSNLAGTFTGSIRVPLLSQERESYQLQIVYTHSFLTFFCANSRYFGR